MPSKKRTAAKAKPAAATDTSENIADLTAEFLKEGGKIDKIESGTSGVKGYAGSRQISLGRR